MSFPSGGPSPGDGFLQPETTVSIPIKRMVTRMRLFICDFRQLFAAKFPDGVMSLPRPAKTGPVAATKSSNTIARLLAGSGSGMAQSSQRHIFFDYVCTGTEERHEKSLL